MAEHLKFDSSRNVDKTLFRKLNKMAAILYLDPTSLARQLLHKSLDEIAAEKGIDIENLATQLAEAG